MKLEKYYISFKKYPNKYKYHLNIWNNKHTLCRRLVCDLPSTDISLLYLIKHLGGDYGELCKICLKTLSEDNLNKLKHEYIIQKLKS